MRQPAHWRLFPKYATLIIALVGGVLIVSGALSLLFSWREIRSHLVALQAEKAQGAATRIEHRLAADTTIESTSAIPTTAAPSAIASRASTAWWARSVTW